MREKGDKPNLNPNGQRESLVMATLTERIHGDAITAGSPRPRRNHSVQVAGPTAGPRARQIRGSPLPVAQGIPISLRTGRQGWKANRASHPSGHFQIAESMGFKGDFRQWEYLLRVGD